jgi:hypothetical protein
MCKADFIVFPDKISCGRKLKSTQNFINVNRSSEG